MTRAIDDGPILNQDPTTGVVTLTGIKWLDINWTHTELNPTALLGFRVVAYTGSDPNDEDKYIFFPIDVGPNARRLVKSIQVDASRTIITAVQALYRNGNQSSWRVLGGGVVVDPDTINVDMPSIVGDGVTAAFIFSGPIVTKSDWQGTCTLSTTARKNWLLRSEDFSASWGNEDSTVTVDSATAPDGTATMDKLIEGVTLAYHGRVQSFSGATITEVWDVGGFFKAGERTRVHIGFGLSATYTFIEVDLTTGLVINVGNPAVLYNPKIKSMGGGIYKFTAQATLDTTTPWFRIRIGAGVGVSSYTGDGTSGLYAWGLFAGKGAGSSYIKTTTTAVALTDYTLLNGVATLYPIPAMGVVCRGLSSKASVDLITQMNQISDDGILSVLEKPSVMIAYSKAQNDYATMHLKAQASAISDTDFVAKFTALQAYITALNPAYNDTSITLGVPADTTLFSDDGGYTPAQMWQKVWGDWNNAYMDLMIKLTTAAPSTARLIESTGNKNLTTNASAPVIDSVTTAAGDLVILSVQTTPSENGSYIVGYTAAQSGVTVDATTGTTSGTGTYTNGTNALDHDADYATLASPTGASGYEQVIYSGWTGTWTAGDLKLVIQPTALDSSVQVYYSTNAGTSYTLKQNFNTNDGSPTTITIPLTGIVATDLRIKVISRCTVIGDWDPINGWIYSYYPSSAQIQSVYFVSTAVGSANYFFTKVANIINQSLWRVTAGTVRMGKTYLATVDGSNNISWAAQTPPYEAPLPLNVSGSLKILGDDGAGTRSWQSTGGGVTSVTGTAPVVSSGGATPAISIAAATDSVPGHLTAADHAAFAAKVTFPGFGTTSLLACVGNDSRLSDSRTPAAHVLNSVSHTVSGLTTGHFLKATGAATFGFAAHGLTYTDVGAQQSLAAIVTPHYNLASAPGSGVLGDVYWDTALKVLRVCTNATGPVFADVTAYDISCSFSGKPTAAQKLLIFPAVRPFTVYATGHKYKNYTNPTATASILVQKNGTTFGTLTISTSGVLTLTSWTETAFAVGDYLTVLAPSSADATLADFGITLQARLS